MGYTLILDPEQIDAAFERFGQILQVGSHGERCEHEEFWARRWFPHYPEKKSDAVRLGRLGSSRDARITVNSSEPKIVEGRIVVDEAGLRHVAHSGRFNPKALNSKLFEQNTKGDTSWIKLEGDDEEKRYYLVTQIDQIDDSNVLDNVARFVRNRFVRQQQSSGGPVAGDDATMESIAMRPLNQILFGPPGTSKTYDAVSKAIAITDRSESDRHRVRTRFRELREAGRVEFVTFHQNYAYEDFIEGIRPVLDDGQKGLRYELRDGIFKQIAARAKANPKGHYVLIVDEINRGNIAKIFGELITLIEPSKRIGEDDQAEATLPYSQEPFSVPSNLYLIGTMNTADRGITELDVALRRRFEFVRCIPDPDHERISEDIDGVNVRDLLRAINKRILEIKDRDHQIGHTYFIGIRTMQELKRIFQVHIIPLLEEYFYDDWEKVRLVLSGSGFIKTERDGVEGPVLDLLPEDNNGWLEAKNYRAIYGA